jgi:catechol 2,3-dioxygenase-like lactoylglutathione lyase family enzyme
MLKDAAAVATVAVKDLARARAFYEGTLGFANDSDMDGVASYQSGTSAIFVYQSEFGGSNQATSATFVVQDVVAEVRTLREKGVAFEHYDLPGMIREGDVHVAGGTQAAWFKDPDGNILAIVSG